MIVSSYELAGHPDAEWLKSVEASCVWGDLCIHTTQGVDVQCVEPLLRSCQCSVRLHSEATESDVLDYLDAGAMYAILTPAQILTMTNVPKNRIACLLSGMEGKVELPKDISSPVILEFADSVPVTRAVVARGCEDCSIPDNFQVIVSGKPPSCLEAGKILKAGYTLQLAGDLTEPDAELSVAGILNSIVKSDREDGLVPTVVVDESQMCLGLVYSSAGSLEEAIRRRRGVYQSRKRGLWYKGESSGDTQDLLRVDIDCDFDSLRFVVRQHGVGFCHLQRYGCFGPRTGLEAMVNILQSRKQNAPEGSYTKRLFGDNKLLQSKLLEEAQELADAVSPKDVAWEAADVLYFAMVKCVRSGVNLSDVERMLDQRTRRVRRRKGDAKPNIQLADNGAQPMRQVSPQLSAGPVLGTQEGPKLDKSGAGSAAAAPVPTVSIQPEPFTSLQVHDKSSITADQEQKLCQRPAVTDNARLMKIVQPILADVRSRGDDAVLELTAKFDRVKLDSPVITVPPLEEVQVTDDVRDALEVAYANVHKFHEAQLTDTLRVETCPGVKCQRFSRPIQKVGLYVPGGSAVLPSTALMLAIPARVAGCENVLLATPPRKDGTISPEVLYVAAKSGIKTILLAGGAQAIAAMAYGTKSVPKVDKICGPGNSFVTMAKMLVQNDSTAMVSIDMPAGPSEVMVVADSTANPEFVAADLLSQAEHGPDSQVVLVAVNLTTAELDCIQEQVKSQLSTLPRAEITSVALGKSFVLQVKTMDEGLEFANRYAPEHLILNVEEAAKYLDKVMNAGSVFIGPYSAESCGDYASGTNHTLPTYSYAKMYSGVSTSTFQKYITSQELDAEGLLNIGPAVATLAAVEGLDAHRQAVVRRMAHIKQHQQS
ncbi:uncharacterized protein LOC135804441 [Sycon ciliatum]|uniref:uncharacterized protein LOC135804441 n=1 Tax=Sycon ciliatum TaxID=27933 RepID=UPI0031F635B0